MPGAPPPSNILGSLFAVLITRVSAVTSAWPIRLKMLHRAISSASDR